MIKQLLQVSDYLKRIKAPTRKKPSVPPVNRRHFLVGELVARQSALQIAVMAGNLEAINRLMAEAFYIQCRVINEFGLAGAVENQFDKYHREMMGLQPGAIKEIKPRKKKDAPVAGEQFTDQPRNRQSETSEATA